MKKSRHDIPASPAQTEKVLDWRKALALGLAAVALSGCVAGDRDSDAPVKPVVSAAQPTPGSERQPGAPETTKTPEVSPVASMIVRAVPEKVDQVFDQGEIRLSESEDGSYRYEVKNENAPEGYTCEGSVGVMADSVRMDVTCHKEGDRGPKEYLYTLNSGYTPATTEAQRMLGQKDGSGKVTPVSYRQLQAMVEKGELQPTTTILARHLGYDTVRTILVDPSGNITEVHKGDKGKESDAQSFAEAVLAEISRLTSSSEQAPQESRNTPEASETEQQLQQIRVEQLRATSVMFEKYGPNILEGGESYVSRAAGGDCVSYLGFNGKKGNSVTVYASTTCMDEGVSLTTRSEYSSSKPAVANGFMKPMSPKEMLEKIASGKLDLDRLEVEAGDTQTGTDDKYTFSKESGLKRDYLSLVTKQRHIEQGDEVDTFNMAEYVDGAGKAADAA